MDLAHLSTNALYVLPFTQFTIPPWISSVWIPTAVPLPPHDRISSESSPSSPNTKPEPLQGQCCCDRQIQVLSGPSCASAPLPMPDSRQRSPKYVVKSSKNRWNSHARNLNAFYRILLILPLILTYHMLSQVKLKEQSQNHSDLHDWLGTSQHQCSVVFLSLMFTISTVD